MSKLTNVFDLIKKYQRPLRTVLWSILISFVLILCLFKTCNESMTVETILVAMFVDMGIYGVSRTIEKSKNIDNNA
jgi:hypothetical protein